MPSPPYLNHLEQSQSLVTTREAKRAGFVSAVLEKSEIADAFVAGARTLKITAEKAAVPEDLLNITDMQAGLLTAAGVSDKATAYLDDSDRREILSEYIERFLKPAGEKFVDTQVLRGFRHQPRTFLCWQCHRTEHGWRNMGATRGRYTGQCGEYDRSPPGCFFDLVAMQSMKKGVKKQ